MFGLLTTIMSTSTERLASPCSPEDPSKRRQRSRAAQRIGYSARWQTGRAGLRDHWCRRGWLRSRPGSGSTFYFTVRLPLAQGLPCDFEAPVAVPAAACVPLRILLVEDGGSLRAMTRELLEHFGYTVLEAEHGERAIQIAGEFKGNISLLLTDVSLPKMKGPAVAKTLMQQRSGIAVLYMSGYAKTAKLDGVHEVGTDFLQKPFTADNLARKVREVLNS